MTVSHEVLTHRSRRGRICLIGLMESSACPDLHVRSDTRRRPLEKSTRRAPNLCRAGFVDDSLLDADRGSYLRVLRGGERDPVVFPVRDVADDADPAGVPVAGHVRGG